MPRNFSPRYTQSGVDESAAKEALAQIHSSDESASPNLLGPAGFASALELPPGYAEPVLVSCCDGVGTKIALLAQADQLTTAGHDLVAACVNDLVCHGAKPWYMLDHICCESLDPGSIAKIVEGMLSACKSSGVELVGGEIAQLPGTLAKGAYEASGHVVGVVEKSKLLSAARVATGDSLIALASSGPHCNGFSLVRSILKESRSELDERLDGQTIGDALLEPCRLYVDAVLGLLADKLDLHACAHVTGGGLAANLERIMPEGLCFRVDLKSWSPPRVYHWLAQRGEIEMDELRCVLNCGVGMVLAVGVQDSRAALSILAALGHDAWPLGEVVAGRVSEYA